MSDVSSAGETIIREGYYEDFKRAWIESLALAGDVCEFCTERLSAQDYIQQTCEFLVYTLLDSVKAAFSAFNFTCLIAIHTLKQGGALLLYKSNFTLNEFKQASKPSKQQLRQKVRLKQLTYWSKKPIWVH